MDLTAAALGNPINRKILERLPMLGAPNACLVAGSVYQAFWNALSDRPVAEGVKDYDIFYFDASDLSYEAEDVVVRKAAALFADLDVLVDVKNQARVHLWYQKRFGGGDYPPLLCVEDGISHFLVRSTCIGLMPQVDGTLRLIAPYGTAETRQGELRPTAFRRDDLTRFREKAHSYVARWPWLKIIEDE
ncbi:nucleotidyltransferase family protein [Dongia sp.]|uniref:nucleotidyltransferase family protein n=1 Tax=Dongia sp. TaxID=1977262 RepID=UPI0037527215